MLPAKSGASTLRAYGKVLNCGCRQWTGYPERAPQEGRRAGSTLPSRASNLFLKVMASVASIIRRRLVLMPAVYRPRALPLGWQATGLHGPVANTPADVTWSEVAG